MQRVFCVFVCVCARKGSGGGGGLLCSAVFFQPTAPTKTFLFSWPVTQGDALMISAGSRLNGTAEEMQLSFVFFCFFFNPPPPSLSLPQINPFSVRLWVTGTARPPVPPQVRFSGVFSQVQSIPHIKMITF